MTAKWAEVKRLFQSDPWGVEGAHGRKAKMAFMATYNLDRFREFVFSSTFLKRYKLKKEIIGASCRNLIHVEMIFDGAKNLVSKQIENGSYIDET